MIPRSMKNILRRGRAAFERKKGPFDRPYYRHVSDDDVIASQLATCRPRPPTPEISHRN